MKKKLLARLRVFENGLPAPVLAILGPIAGLLYIAILPVIGAFTLGALILYRVGEGARVAWRKIAHSAAIA